MHNSTRGKLLLATYLMTVLYALHYGIPLYITSTFLSLHFNGSIISALYMLGSLVTIFVSFQFTKYLKYFHTYSFVLFLVVGEILSTIAFAVTTSTTLIALFFILHFCLQSLILVCLNIFIETFTKRSETGMTRGIFLMLLNLGILISPFIGGAILNTQGFTVLYSVAALILVPFVFFLNRYMKHAQEPVYHTINMNRALYHIFRNKDLRGATVAIFLLEYFYATMIIYFPLYLTSLGISLITYLTVIIPISLIPLVVLPYELGILADKKYGEKEMLILGMILMAATVLILSVMTTTYMLWWIAVLFVSRIGATCVETMAYSYFYKKINPEDVSLTAVFSNMRSVATVIASIAGIILAPLVMTYPQVIFIVLALALLFGVTYIIPIKDTL